MGNNKKFFISFFFLFIYLIFPTSAKATIYYVSTAGNDSYNGIYDTYQGGSNGPWLTVQKAASTLVAGDTVLIRDGIYNSTNRITPKNSGTANTYITYKAYPGEHPDIRTKASQGFFIVGTSTSKIGYIEVNGLTMTAEGSDPNAVEFCTSGFYTEQAHHIRVLNNIVRGSGGSGITFETGSDYGYVEGNTVYDNCWGCSTWRGSGINFHRIMWYDQAPGFHNIVRKNIVYHNWHDPNYVKNHSDGNAFIVDESNYVNASGDNPPVLFENNVAFDNAGPCFNNYKSSNIKIVNNTCYQNVSDSYEITSGEINIDGSFNIEAYNNILVPRSGAKASRQGSTSSGLSFDYNLSFGGIMSVSGAHDIIADPKLINPTIDPLTANFHLKSGSPAIDVALASQAPTNDYDGISRPQGSGYDIGAYEYQPSLTPIITPSSSPTPTAARKPGDANGDNMVDGIDYVIWLNHYSQQTNAGYTVGDFNSDKRVDGIDYVIWRNNSNK